MRIKILDTLIITTAALTLSVRAATILTGDAGDTPFIVQAFGANSPPTVDPVGGNPGGSLVLTPQVNGLVNTVGFDLTDPGPHPFVIIAFQFKITSAASADGFSFNLLDTTAHNVTGAGPQLTEDPLLAGVLGFGFDTWSNNGSIAGPPGDPNSADDPNQVQGSNYDEISLFYNNALIQRVDDTRLLGITLDDGAWHNVTGTVDFITTLVNLSVDNAAILTNTAVPGLAPFESRAQFAARTGGENERVDIDNVNVQFVPEPTAAVLGAIGLTLLFRRRRL